VCEVSDHGAALSSSLALLAAGEAAEDEEEEQADGNARGQRSFARRKIRRTVFNGRVIPNLEAGGGISRPFSAEERSGRLLIDGMRENEREKENK